MVIEPPPPLPVGSGAISGVITDAATGRPISGAIVGLFSPPADIGRPRQVTDEAGRFLFKDIPAADYTLSASHPDYLWAGFNATAGEQSARIVLADAQWFADANIRLSKPASLSGTVLDERGEPVVGVPVRILTAVEIAGTRRWATGSYAETDDRGMYRVADLRPGTYIVHVPSVQITLADGAVRPPIPPQRPLAMARQGGVGTIVGHFPTSGVPGRGYPMAYHPAARSTREAVPIALESGEARSGVDVHMALATTVRVSGALRGPPDAVASLSVWLVPTGDETSGPGGEAAVTLSDPNGAFTLLNVPAGSYTLIASRSQSEYSTGGRGGDRLMPERGDAFNISMVGGYVAGVPGVSYATRGRAGMPAFGRTSILVEDRDVTNVVVPLTTGVRVSGHFLWDGRPGGPEGAFVPRVGLESADGDLLRGFPQSAFSRYEGSTPSPVPFVVEGVLPGRYLLGTAVAGGLSLEAAEYRGRDLLTTPMEVAGDADITGVVIRLTSMPARISGMVLDASGASGASGAVIVFPVRVVRPAADGSFIARDLPDGAYRLAAVPDVEDDEWRHPSFLEPLVAVSLPVAVAEGMTTRQSIRIK